MKASKSREAPRVILNQPGLRFLPGENRYEHVNIVDISESGARLELCTPEAANGPMKVFWSPVPGLPPLLIEGEGVWRRHHLCGMRFQTLSPRLRSIIRGLLRHHREAA